MKAELDLDKAWRRKSLDQIIIAILAISKTST